MEFTVYHIPKVFAVAIFGTLALILFAWVR
jgi:hypothetical protein